MITLDEYIDTEKLPEKLSKKLPKKLPKELPKVSSTGEKCAVGHDCEGEVKIRETNRKGIVIPLCDKHYKRLVKVGLDINLFMSGGK